MRFREDERLGERADMKLCFITFHSQGSSTSLISSITGIFSTILHTQLVYVQDLGGGSLLDTVLLPMGEDR